MEELNLLRQALTIGVPKKRTRREDLREATQVALAYLDQRITGPALMQVLRRKGSANANNIAGAILGQAYQRGIIRIEMTEDNERGGD